MQVFGNIGTPLKERTSGNGRTYYEFRLAESQRRRPEDAAQGNPDLDRPTTWYTVRAFISELEADMLGKGMFVKVTGTLSVEAYLSKQDNKPVGAATILTSSVVFVPRKTAAEAQD